MRTERTIAFRVLAVILSFLMSPLPQFAQSGQHAGSISAMRPSVTRNAKPATAKEALNWNDLVNTDNSGRMRIALDDGSLLSVGTSSQMRIVRHDAKTQQTQLEIAYGRMRSQIAKLTQPGSVFQIRTPTAVAGVIGTDFFLDVTPTATRMVVYEGTVLLTPIIAGVVTESQAVQVHQGQTAEVTENGITGPNQTPNDMEEQTISQTSLDVSTTAGTAAAGSHALRNVLIGIGIAGAAVGAGIAASKSGGDKPPNQQIPAK